MKHTTGIIIQPKRLCYALSTLPGFVFDVHVILFVMLDASIANMRIFSDDLVHVWVV